MAFFRLDGSSRKSLPNQIAKKASTAMAVGAVVISTSGQVDVATSSSVLLLGLAMKKIASTDDDFASTTAVTVEEIDPNAYYLADVGTGTATVADIGEQHDLTDSVGVDMTASTNKQVSIVGVVDSTHVIVKFNPAQIIG